VRPLSFAPLAKVCSGTIMILSVLNPPPVFEAITPLVWRLEPLPPPEPEEVSSSSLPSTDAPLPAVPERLPEYSVIESVDRAERVPVNSAATAACDRAMKARSNGAITFVVFFIIGFDYRS
jgi:hypothetical protein